MSGEKKEKLKEYQRNYRQENYKDLIMYAMFFVHALLNLKHLCHPYRLTEIKA